MQGILAGVPIQLFKHHYSPIILSNIISFAGLMLLAFYAKIRFEKLSIYFLIALFSLLPFTLFNGVVVLNTCYLIFSENLPHLNEESAVVNLIGSDTKSSIISGVVNGIAGEIKNITERYRQKHQLLKVFFTGGDSEFIKSIVKFEKNGIFAVENLTMIGLNTILHYNDK